MPNAAAIVVLALVIFAIVLVAKGIKIIKQAEVMVVERLGKIGRASCRERVLLGV